MKKETWYDVWSKRGDKVKEFDPIKLDGWDTATSTITQEIVHKIIKTIIEKLELSVKDFVLEIGCGAGMLLIPISKIVGNISGLDYSESLTRRLKEFNENFELKVAEANKMPFEDNYFDKVFSNSVFQYFPSLEYTEEVISEIVRVMKPRGSILLLDIYDIETKEEFIKIEDLVLSARLLFEIITS